MASESPSVRSLIHLLASPLWLCDSMFSCAKSALTAIVLRTIHPSSHSARSPLSPQRMMTRLRDKGHTIELASGANVIEILPSHPHRPEDDCSLSQTFALSLGPTPTPPHIVLDTSFTVSRFEVEEHSPADRPQNDFCWHSASALNPSPHHLQLAAPTLRDSP